MGACCGKGAAPKDPDKTPYGPAKSTSGDVSEHLKGKASGKPTAATSGARSKANEPTKGVAAERRDASVTSGGAGDADSFVVIEVRKLIMKSVR